MTLPAAKIEETCDSIRTDLTAFAGDHSRLDELLRAVSSLEWLRGQYRVDKTAFEQHVDALKDLSRQVTDSLRTAREALTSEFIQASEALTAWRRRREVCRCALIDLVGADGVGRFDSPDGWVDVRGTEALSLPKPGTDSREEIRAIVTQAGRWPDLGVLNARRLREALSKGLFFPAEAARIHELCPTREAHRLIAHPRDGG